MVSGEEEILEAKVILNEVADSLKKEAFNFNRNIKIGVMIEVPSAVMMADTIAKQVDFLSIGTNDLIQYTLAIDRGNKDVSHLYQPLHPAIIRMLKRVSDAARYNDVKVFMCGQIAGDPLYIPILLGLGIHELSMSPLGIPVIKHVIRQLKFEDTERFTESVLRQTTAGAIMKMLKDTYGDILFQKNNIQATDYQT